MFNTTLIAIIFRKKYFRYCCVHMQEKAYILHTAM